MEDFKRKVAILMGSKSDEAVMKPALMYWRVLG